MQPVFSSFCEGDGKDLSDASSHEIQSIPFFGCIPSRVNSEFQVLCEIGRGAFGDVIKVGSMTSSVLSSSLRRFQNFL